MLRPGLRGTTPNYVCKSERSNVSSCQRLSFAITGNPADDYFVSPSKSLVRETGEFGLDALPMGTVLGFHLTFPTR